MSVQVSATGRSLAQVIHGKTEIPYLGVNFCLAGWFASYLKSLLHSIAPGLPVVR